MAIAHDKEVLTIEIGVKSSMDRLWLGHARIPRLTAWPSMVLPGSKRKLMSRLLASGFTGSLR